MYGTPRQNLFPEGNEFYYVEKTGRVVVWCIIIRTTSLLRTSMVRIMMLIGEILVYSQVNSEISSGNIVSFMLFNL